MEPHSILDDYFSKTFKPSERLIREHQAFFDQLDTIKTVHVLGLSLSDVDLPYIQALLKVPSVSTAYWYVTYLSTQGCQAKCDLLIVLGVGAQKAATALWSDY